MGAKKSYLVTFILPGEENKRIEELKTKSNRRSKVIEQIATAFQAKYKRDITDCSYLAATKLSHKEALSLDSFRKNYQENPENS